MNKSTIILIYFIVFSTLVHSQETFLKIYPSPENQEVFGIVETNDNHLIICGSIEVNSIPDNNSGQLIKTTTSGEFVLSAILSITDNLKIYYRGIKKGYGLNNLYYLVGYKDSIVGHEDFNAVFINTIDNNLNTLSSRMYSIGSEARNVALDFEVRGDSIAYILSFWYQNNSTTRWNYSLIKADLIHDSSIIYTPSPNRWRAPSGLIFDDINNTLKVNYRVFDLNMYPWNPVDNISPDLANVQEVMPENEFFTQTRIKKKGNTSYFLSGSNIYLNGLHRELGIAEYNMSDSLLKQVIFPGSADSMTYPAAGNSILVSAEYIWLVGWYNVIPQNVPCSFESSWVVLNKLNHDLELQEQLFYGGDGVYVPKDIIGTADQHLVVTGDYYDPNHAPYECQFDPFVLKVNSEGLIVNTTNPNMPVAQEALVFPNPGSGYLQVKLAIQHPQARLQLFDMNGRSILEEEISTDMQQVNTSSLPTGIYPYRITANGRVIGNGKWVKE